MTFMNGLFTERKSSSTRKQKQHISTIWVSSLADLFRFFFFFLNLLTTKGKYEVDAQYIFAK